MFFYLRKLCLKSLFLIALSHLIVWLLFSKKKKKKKIVWFSSPNQATCTVFFNNNDISCQEGFVYDFF